MKEIKLTQGMVALIDDEDFERIDEVCWCAARSGNLYAAKRSVFDHITGQWLNEYMHWWILPLKYGYTIDHINGDELDNRRCNLRYATQQQQTMNKAKTSSKCSSKYKGVSYQKMPYQNPLKKPWRASLMYNGRRQSLGFYATEEEAAQAYDRRAVKIFGEFARLNFGT